jgi:antitoxin (DNA-binding transcriptional repressor) of toxin-antitoxin stability system
MITVTTHEAKTHLSRLLSKIAEGEDVLILRGTQPTARLTAVRKTRARGRPRVGAITSVRFACPDSVFAPLTEEQMKAEGWL